MIRAYDVATVRAAEAAVMAGLPDGVLMERAATGLARAVARLLQDVRGGVAGARVALLVGSGNNGGDALWAGAFLARRGARVVAVALSDRVHEAGAAALVRSGGRLFGSGGGSAAAADSTAAAGSAAAVRDADVLLDGVVGIGGAGALRPAAAELVRAAVAGGALVVAVDVPSGVSSDTGAVADAAAVVDADVTVTFGCLKQGLLLAPGRDRAGAVELVDIGLGPALPATQGVRVLEPVDLAALVPEPGTTDHKYTRGVVGVLAGSARYRGAALLAVGSARRGDVGMVRYLDRGDGLATAVVEHYPDVVVHRDDPAADPRVRAWAVGPGMGEGPDDRAAVLAVLRTPGPVVLDADGLRHLAADDGQVRAAVRDRAGVGAVTVVTPHEGEFARLGYRVGTGADEDRLGATRRAAAELSAVVLLKGPGTVVAAPDGTAYVDTFGTSVLGSAGSGDVLTGLLGALLAGAVARGDLAAGDGAGAAHVAAAAAGIHGVAGRLAGAEGRPVTAVDLLDALPAAVAAVRRGVAVP